MNKLSNTKFRSLICAEALGQTKGEKKEFLKRCVLGGGRGKGVEERERGWVNENERRGKRESHWVNDYEDRDRTAG